MRSSLIISALAGVASGFVPQSARILPTSHTSQPSAITQPSQHTSLPSLRASESNTDSSSDNESSSAAKHPSDWQSQILSALSAIIDPDLNSSIVSLGFIQNLSIDSSSIISLTLQLPSPFRPVGDAFVKEIQDTINTLEWTRGTDLSVTNKPAEAPTGSPLGMSQIGAVVAVSSCKGGVGKSTTAVNLAFALQGMGAKVGVFDADVYGPSLPTMVTPEDDNVRFVGRQIAPLRRDGVKLMSFGYINEGSAIMRGAMVTQLLDQFLSMTAWGDVDYLIMDMPPGTGDIQLTLSQKLDICAAVIVTTPAELSYVDVERGVEMFDTVNVPCIAVVENMAWLEKGEEDAVAVDEAALREKFLEALQKDGTVGDASEASSVADELVRIVRENVQHQNNGKGEPEKERIFGPGHKHRLSEQWGIEHTYSIPLMGKIARNGDSGTPYILENPNSPQADVYRQLACSVVSEVAKTKFDTQGSRPSVEYNRGSHVIEVVEGRSSSTSAGISGDDDRGEEPVSTLSPATLRRACRCAECVEEMTGRQLLDPGSVPKSIFPLTMSPTGNYALSVDWSDGHKSLYPYRQIRDMIEAEEEGAGVEEGGVVSAKEKALI